MRSPNSFLTRTLSVLFLAFTTTTVVRAQTTGTTVVVNGQVFVNQGLVGVGRMPHNLKDKFGETFGSFSALTFQPGTWQRNSDGSYSGTLFAQPDRGYNVTATTNYIPRFNKISVRLTPSAIGGTSQNQVELNLLDTVQYTESNGTPLTSFDPTPTGTGTRTGFPALPQAFNNRISLDAEGIVINPDGTLFISDEYGPYVYKFSADGKLLSAIRPPEAVIPKRGGADSFASNNPGDGQPVPSPADPTVGRQNNQGLERLSLSPDGKTLFALLQSATRQDGGVSGTSPLRFNTRLFAYDLTTGTPTLRAEYVFQLPTFQQSGTTRVAAQSEIFALNNTQFLVIARDAGNGHGLLPTSNFRKVMIYDITGATNIAGTAFDQSATPIAPNGVLDAAIKPATRAELIDINETAQLAKFGLHNGPTDDGNNLSEKWEGMTLVPSLDPATPNDWFLLIGNDNDFLTTQGFQAGGSYNAGVDNDSMILVYRITLPARLLNVSSRAQTGTGANSHIVGFVVSGAKPKSLLIRGVGAALGSLGVAGNLSDPTLGVYDSVGRQLFSNDNWNDNTNVADIRSATARTGAFALTEASKDAALLVTLDPGVYNAQVNGVGGTTGVSLLEIYEVP